MIGVTKEYIFNNPADFTFDNTKSAITDKLRLRDIIAYHKSIYGSTFFANYESDINGLWANGVLTGTPYNGASVANGKLDLKANGKLVDYAALNNGDSQQQFCVRMQVIPDFSGIGASHNFISITKAHGDTTNWIAITQHHNGQMKVIILDKDKISIVNQLLPVWHAVQGQLVEFELNGDITLGETRLFLNGVQWGILMAGTGVRDSNIGVVRIGSDFNQNGTSNSEFENVLIFDSVQHTSDYVPDWSGVPIDVLSKNTQKIAVKDIFKQDELFEVSAPGLVEPANTKVRGFQRVNGQAYWYNVVNGQIETSNESIDQANTLAEYEEYLTEKYDPPQNTQLVVLIKSDDGIATPEVEKIIFKYSYAMQDIDKGMCNIESEVGDIDMTYIDPIKELTMTIELVNPGGYYKIMQLHGYKKTIKSVNQKFNFHLLQTTDMGTEAYYTFSWRSGDSANEEIMWEKTIPNTLFGSTLKELPDRL